jgi:DNA-binding Lrp family transcriptional regulator
MHWASILLKRIRLELDPIDRLILSDYILADDPSTQQDLGDKAGVSQVAIWGRIRRLKLKLLLEARNETIP